MFNPINASESIKQSFRDYITTTFNIEDEHYAQQFREALNREGAIAKGPYLDISGTYETGKSLDELVENETVTKLFLSLEAAEEKDKELKLERPLYSHQQRALELAAKGESIVVTTGTGSGKTECFLLPIINTLLQETEKGTLSPGVRAIIIYPMNALANDQMKRLRKLLKSFTAITFGVYTGDTEHEQNRAESDYRKLYGDTLLNNERISRERMQESPPHILITNYSMLEYMMLRPKEDAIFSGAQLRFIVLDEAHIYRGATGIETALLMRRLKARISKPEAVQYIITSATLGGKEADKEILAFAENLCGVSFKAESIIRAIEIHQPMISENDYPASIFIKLCSGERSISEILGDEEADFATGRDDREKLFEFLLHSSLFGKFRRITDDKKTLTVNEIADRMEISKDELVDFIVTCSKAEKNGISLIKARYHFFVRALEGVYITLNAKKELFLTRKEHDENNNTVFEMAVCDECGRIAIAGNYSYERRVLTHPKQGHDDDTEFFLIKQSKEEELFNADEDDSEKINVTSANDYVVCPVCGAIEAENLADSKPPCEHSAADYIKVKQAMKRAEKDDGEAACPACDSRRGFRRFYLGYEAATSVLATTLFEELPEEALLEAEAIEDVPLVNERDSTEVFFASDPSIARPKMQEKARQFLAFSDSRADAAFFASYMDKSYQEFLRRRGLWHVCERFAADGYDHVSVGELIDYLSRFFEENRTFVEIDKEADTQRYRCRHEAVIAVMNELVSSRRSSGLVQLGKMGFVYAPKKDNKQKSWESAVETVSKFPEFVRTTEPVRNAESLLNLLILRVVFDGALDARDLTSLGGEDLEYLFFSDKKKTIVKMKEAKSKETWKTGWLPRQRTGEKKTYYYNTRHKCVIKALGWDEVKSWRFLEEMWINVLQFDAKEYALSIEDFDIVFQGSPAINKNPLFFQCDKCGKVTNLNCLNHCSNIKCDGVLQVFDPEKAAANNHYVSLYGSNRMTPLYIKEHTAQLSRDRAAEYQNLFIDKKIHALSSSTTFELGVDVGTLETVFLRDVPPSPANYVQRAGRAGRSLGVAAYALTYAKLSSHDFTYYEEPEKMIQGEIKAPSFNIHNEKIIRRHINAIVLSSFFKRHSEIYAGDDLSPLLNYKGYEKLIDYLKEKPSDLLDSLKNSIPEPCKYGIENWSFTDDLIGSDGSLALAVQDFRETVKLLEDERDACYKAQNDRGMMEFGWKLKNFRGDRSKEDYKKSLIDFLVRNNVLPKYGFPVDTAELLPEMFVTKNDKDKPQMQRDLQLAVAEYAPGSEIVADGKLYTSRYIRKLQSNTYNWEYGWNAKCPNKACEAINFHKDADHLQDSFECISCSEKIPKSHWKRTLEPRRGFISEGSKDVKMRKPRKTFRTDAYYVGDPRRMQIDMQSFSVNGRTLHIESTANDTLVVLTQSRFQVCTTCGYAVNIDEGEKFEKEHKNSFGHVCSSKGGGYEFKLSHNFKTDVLRITFENDSAKYSNTMLSVLYALLEAVANVLDVERNDIKGCLYMMKQNGMLLYSVIIYDAVPGGAGHVRRVLSEGGSVLSDVIKKAIEITEKCDCEPSCYKCLRNYNNQKIHHLLDRHKAYSFLKEYYGSVSVLDPVPQKEEFIQRQRDDEQDEQKQADFKPRFAVSQKRTPLKVPDPPLFPDPPKPKEKIVWAENISTLDSARDHLFLCYSNKPMFGEDIVDLVNILDSYKPSSENVAELIGKRFPAPQLAYSSHMSRLSDLDDLFLKLMRDGANKIGGARRRSAEINEGLEIIKNNARKLSAVCEQMENKLLNNKSSEDELTKEINALLEDFQVLIESVKNYS